MLYADDYTMISYPPPKNTEEHDYINTWYTANNFEITSSKWESIPSTISVRFEHTAILSRLGNMIVWGGRFQDTDSVYGVWSLNVAGEHSKVEYRIRPSQDGDFIGFGMAYLLLVLVMLSSMCFTYVCGVLTEHYNEDERADAMGDDNNMFNDPSLSIFDITSNRNGLRQDIIDTLPVEKYRGETKEGSTKESQADQPSTNNLDFTSFDDEKDCCPICLVEYEDGDELRVLPCGHSFHKACTDAWLSNHANCPSCRHSLEDLVPLTTRQTFAESIRATLSRSRNDNNTSSPRVQVDSTTIEVDDRSTVESLQRLLLALSSEIQRREVEDSAEASNLGDVELSTTTTTRTTSIVVSGDQLPIEGSVRRMTVSSDSPISRRVRDSRSRRRREGSRVPLGEILSDNELI